jgi:hypothetical protein
MDTSLSRDLAPVRMWVFALDDDDLQAIVRRGKVTL